MRHKLNALLTYVAMALVGAAMLVIAISVEVEGNTLRD